MTTDFGAYPAGAPTSTAEGYHRAMFERRGRPAIKARLPELFQFDPVAIQRLGVVRPRHLCLQVRDWCLEVFLSVLHTLDGPRAENGNTVTGGSALVLPSAQLEALSVLLLKINGAQYEVDVDPSMPLLWVLRDELGLTGTKYGCGIASCGACTVLVDGIATRSCALRIGDVKGEVTTIERLGTPEAPHIVQQEWIRNQVAQCGYCQSGQIVTAVSLLARNDSPSDADIDRAFSGNLCRCGTYVRIRQAVRSAAERLKASS